MFAHVSLLGVLLAAFSAMVIGTVWYSRALFGKQWQRAAGITDNNMKDKMPVAMVVLVVVSLVTAYVLAQFIVYAHAYPGNSWMHTGFSTALLAWAGLAATALIAHEAFENRDKSLLYINVGNRLVTLVVMGLILGALLK